jgi:hypothetical protein
MAKSKSPKKPAELTNDVLANELFSKKVRDLVKKIVRPKR